LTVQFAIKLFIGGGGRAKGEMACYACFNKNILSIFALYVRAALLEFASSQQPH
jgi:hypothetical protein